MTLGKAKLSEPYCPKKKKRRTISGRLGLQLGGLVLASTHWALGSPHPSPKRKLVVSSSWKRLAETRGHSVGMTFLNLICPTSCDLLDYN